MRTTVDIPDAIYRQLKAQAAHEGTSAKKLILRGVEKVLTENCRKPKGKRIKFPIVPFERTGLIRIDNARIYDIISFP
jgi:hypothetical protein